MPKPKYHILVCTNSRPPATRNRLAGRLVLRNC